MSDSRPTRVLASGDTEAGRRDRHRLLAELALHERAHAASGLHTQSRHLAFLPADALDLDLSDPAQREFGDYELLEKLGQGGMGVVYRAHQRSLDREVALKLLAAGPWASSDFIERFRREAQSAARMQHPNIVSVFEIASHDWLNYFSMALVRGESLAQRLAREGPMPPRAAAALLRTVAEAVDYAHRLNVLHLDLKPGNVLIDERGEPMVADFGLARRLDDELARDNDEVSGTPSYMAPEQAQLNSRGLSRATDIYGLGAILYELLGGRPPFLSATPQQTLEQVVRQDVAPLRTHRPDVDPDLEAICLTCLRKDPSARYASARLLAEDLDNYLQGREVRVRPLPLAAKAWRWARREPRLAAAVGALGLALAAGLAATSWQWQRARASTDDAQNLLWESRREAALRLEQDGRGYDALPRLLANIDEQRAAGRGAGARLDRVRVGMLLGQGATLIDRAMILDANPLAVAISPDGQRVAVALNDLSVRWLDASTLEELGRVDLAPRSTSDGQRRAPMLLRFIDDRRLLATLEWYTNLISPTDGDTWLVDIAGGAVLEPPAGLSGFADAAFSRDGRHAVLRRKDRTPELWAVGPWRRIAVLGPPREDFFPWIVGCDARYAIEVTMTQRMLVLHERGAPAKPRPIALPISWSYSAWAHNSDCSQLALGTTDGQMLVLDTRTWEARELPSTGGQPVTWITFSEDDQWLASGQADGNAQLFDLARGRLLSAGGLAHDFPIRRVGVSRARSLLVAAGDGEVALWRLPQDGPRAGRPARIGAAPVGPPLAGHYAVAWSFETGLLATAGLDGELQLWRMPYNPMPPVRAAYQLPVDTRFDGDHLVDVAWNHVRIVDRRGVPRGDWLTLEQPPGFAELLDDGALLVATVGPWLHVHDAHDLKRRYPPLLLPASPQRLLPAPTDGRILLGFGAHDGQRYTESLRLFDVANGRRLSGELQLRGPLRAFRWSPDGSRLLVVGPTEGSTVVAAADDLRVLAEFDHDPIEPIQWADFSAASNHVALARRAVDPRLGSDRLEVWDPDADAMVASVPLGRVRPLVVAGIAAGWFVGGSAEDVVVGGQGLPQGVERLATTTATAVLASSPAQGVFARGYANEAQLHDAATARPIGPPLAVGGEGTDGLAGLAFSPSGDVLLGRTLHGRYVSWRVGADLREAAGIARGAGSDGPRAADANVIVLPGAADRSLQRERDPGPWPVHDERPHPPIAAVTEFYGDKVPARLKPLPPGMIDLSALYELAPETVHDPVFRLLPTLRPYPTGAHRIGGVDFDIRGAVHVANDRTWLRANEVRGVRRLDCVAAGLPEVGSLHLLSAVNVRNPVGTGQPLAEVRLRYADGGMLRVPLRAGVEMPGYAGDDDAVPMVFSTDPQFALLGFHASDGLYDVRIANPEPGRALRCFDVEAVGGHVALAILAITASAH